LPAYFHRELPLEWCHWNSVKAHFHHRLRSPACRRSPRPKQTFFSNTNPATVSLSPCLRLSPSPDFSFDAKDFIHRKAYVIIAVVITRYHSPLCCSVEFVRIRTYRISSKSVYKCNMNCAFDALCERKSYSCCSYQHKPSPNHHQFVLFTRFPAWHQLPTSHSQCQRVHVDHRSKNQVRVSHVIYLTGTKLGVAEYRTTIPRARARGFRK
jgi:hypothetical protein